MGKQEKNQDINSRGVFINTKSDEVLGNKDRRSSTCELSISACIAGVVSSCVTNDQCRVCCGSVEYACFYGICSVDPGFVSVNGNIGGDNDSNS